MAPVGIPTRGWHGDEIDWFCASNYIDIGTFSGAHIPTNLAYYVTGDTSDRAYEAKLVLNVNDPGTKEQGLQHLAEATQALGTSTRLKVPAAFIADVAAGREVSHSTDQIQYSLTLRKDRIETYRVLIADAGVMQAKEAARSAAIRASAEVFKACKEAIARDLSYSEASLSGDGYPIEGEGHRSYIIKGHEGDSFFCEVYPGGAYKLKAVFGNSFPFRYVSSGERLLEKHHAEVDSHKRLQRVKEDRYQRMRTWYLRYLEAIAPLKVALKDVLAASEHGGGEASLQPACDRFRNALSQLGNADARSMSDPVARLHFGSVLAAFDELARACTDRDASEITVAVAGIDRALQGFATALRPYGLTP